jgi:hypothetical protein
MLPLNVGICLLFLDARDCFGALFFFAIYHNYFYASEGKRATNFVAAGKISGSSTVEKI